MIKKFFLAVFFITAVICGVFGATACSCAPREPEPIYGTYYLFENYELDKTQCIIINEDGTCNLWGEEGTYELDGSDVLFDTAKWDSQNLPASYWRGLIKIYNGETVYYYYKEGFEPRRFTYSLSNNKSYYILTDINIFDTTDIVIEPTYKGLPVKVIGSSAFRSLKITSVTIPDSITKIGSCAFEWCTELTSLEIPDSVTEIGKNAFEGCTNLESINISGAITKVCESTFANCTNLNEVVLPDSVKTIEKDAFNSCENLTGVNMPKSLINIEPQAFWYCKNLKGLTLPDGLTEIGYEAFHGCRKLESVNIPDKLTKIGVAAFADCPDIASITVSGNNKTYYGKDNCIIERKSNKLIFGCKNSIIPEGVTEIGSYAFYYCDGLTHITIPDSVTKIGGRAFTHCRELTEIVIPDGVTYIGGDAFGSCRGIKSIFIPKSVEYIGKEAFSRCEGIESLSVDKDNGYFYSQDNCIIERQSNRLILGCKNSVIPDGVTVIGTGAFEYCGVTEITIPVSVTEFEEYAFCGHELRTIYYEGTMEQWNAIKKEEHYAWDHDTHRYTVKCTDGDIIKK